jgi:hypothetical protein
VVPEHALETYAGADRAIWLRLVIRVDATNGSVRPVLGAVLCLVVGIYDCLAPPRYLPVRGVAKTKEKLSANPPAPHLNEQIYMVVSDFVKRSPAVDFVLSPSRFRVHQRPSFSASSIACLIRRLLR